MDRLALGVSVLSTVILAVVVVMGVVKINHPHKAGVSTVIVVVVQLPLLWMCHVNRAPCAN